LRAMCRSTARFSGPCPVRTRLSLGRRAYLKGFKVERPSQIPTFLGQ
jgi:hypothetical protein